MSGASGTGAKTPRRARFLLLLSLAAAFVAYLPITRIYFVADDFVDMIHIENTGAFHFLVSPFGGHMIFTRNLEVLAMYALFGVRHPEAYGWLNLVTHLVNVALFFRVTRRITTSSELAALGAMLWGTCPVLSEALGWFSVHGQILTGTFVLLFLDRITGHQATASVLSRKSALLSALLLFLGATCFGGAITVAVLSPLLVWLLLDAPLRPPRAMAILGALPVVVITLYLSWNWIYAQLYGAPLDTQILRQTVLTSIPPIARMLGYLVAIGTTSLLDGYRSVAVEYPTVVWPFVLTSAALVGGSVSTGDVRLRRLSLVLGIVALAVYGTIALGRANVYAMFGVGAREAARQLRYHYVSTIPLGLLLLLSLGQVLRSRKARHVPVSLLVGWLAANAWFFATGPEVVRSQAECRKYVAASLGEIEARIDRAPPGSDVEIPNRALPRDCTGFMGYSAIPGWAGLFLLFHPENQVRGRNVYFLEVEDYAGMFDSPRNRRLWNLLLPP